MAKTLSKLFGSLTGSDDPRWATAATAVTGLAGTAGLVWLTWKYFHHLPASFKIKSADETDSALLEKGSRFECYKTRSGIIYPQIRTFFKVHPQAEKLPQDLPLFVFVHGLGGSIAQFEKLLTPLTQVATCLAIDLPGCGRSVFDPQDVEAYTTTAFAELLFAAIDRFRDKDSKQKVVLIGHSMGCSISALLASTTSPLADLCSDIVIAMIAICPRPNPPSDEDLLKAQRLNYIPSLLFDVIRMYDRRGGTASHSVARVIGEEADLETKKLQLRFNQQSKSRVFQKFTAAIVKQETEAKRQGIASVLGRHTWEGVHVPLYLFAAESDKLTPPEGVDQIIEWLTHPRHDSTIDDSGKVAPDHQQFISSLEQDSTVQMDQANQETTEQDVSVRTILDTNQTRDIKEEHRSSKHSHAITKTIFPSPSSHGIIYASDDARVLARYIEKFLEKHVDSRLAPSWQLQHLATSGKWEVKNFEKWKKVQPCSEPIGGVFRGMKTMREVDDAHCPKEFVKQYSWKVVPDGVAVVIDLSFDTPVYDPAGLREGGVEYHKIPIVSKHEPAKEEVKTFIDQVDALRQNLPSETATIGVHCHYGYNRTGFLIVCYLVEKLNWEIHAAIDEFGNKRPPGIKHDYFRRELEARYRATMVRRGTIFAS